MAGELRAKLVAANRKTFGPHPNAPEGGLPVHGGGHPNLVQSLATETAVGKAIEKPLEGVAEKVHSTGKFLQKKATSNMAKALMADATKAELAKQTAKHGATKLAGQGLKNVAGKLVPVVGTYDSVATGLNLLNKLHDKTIEIDQKKYDAGKRDFEYGDPRAEYGMTMESRPKDSPLKGKELPTVAGKVIEGAEHIGKALISGKDTRDMVKKYPQHASKPQSRPGQNSGYGSRPLE